MKLHPRPSDMNPRIQGYLYHEEPDSGAAQQRESTGMAMGGAEALGVSVMVRKS
jgi:hypothetical protein